MKVFQVVSEVTTASMLTRWYKEPGVVACEYGKQLSSRTISGDARGSVM